MKLKLLIILFVTLFFSSAAFSQKLSISELFNLSNDYKEFDRTLQNLNFKKEISDEGEVSYLFFENGTLSESSSFKMKGEHILILYAVLDPDKYLKLKNQVLNLKMNLVKSINRVNGFYEEYENIYLKLNISVLNVSDNEEESYFYIFQILPK